LVKLRTTKIFNRSFMRRY